MARFLVVVCLLTGAGVVMVQLRREMAAASHRIQALHRQRVDCEQELWQSRMELADLRVPARVRERVEKLGLPVNPPHVARRVHAAQEGRQHGTIRTED